MITIAEHSFDLSMLNTGSHVLDLGCRDYGWATEMLQFVSRIYCVDADPAIIAEDPRMHTYAAAIGPKCGIAQLVRYGNGTGNFVYDGEPLPHNYSMQQVSMVDIPYLCSYWGIERWDLIKMDIEGSEYDVLMALDKPPARQLSVELHEHTAKKKGTDWIWNILFDHLEKWYTLSHYVFEERHGCGKNFWDVLFTLKPEHE